MKENQQRQAYTLLTTISMIVGIVIGSGIYFKADDILGFAGGNLSLALLSLVIASSGIVFGGLSLSELARRTTDSGGLANYMEKFVHPAFGATLGFFQSFVYLPSLTAVVSWVGAIYTGQVLGAEWSLEMQIFMAFVYLTVLALLNIFSRQLGGLFQTVSTGVKVLPLLFVAGIGLFWSGASPSLPTAYELVPVRDVGWGWLSALVPLAFAYDGWHIVATIASEVKNPKKNLPRALLLGPLIILVLYMLYIYALSTVLGSSYVLSVGNDAIQHFLTEVVGPRAVTLFLVIIVISVLGVANGILLGNMRMPQALAEKGWLKSAALERLHPRYQLSMASSLLIYGVTVFYLLLHYLSLKYQWLESSDISEISVVFNSLSLLFLYGAILKRYRSGEISNRLTGFIAPILAMAGGILVFVGSLMNNFWQVLIFMGICSIVSLVGYLLYRRNQ